MAHGYVCCLAQVRELLSAHDFPGDDIPVIRGSALCALEGREDAIGKDAVRELMQQVDDFIPTPQRDTEKDFVMPVEGTYSIAGRGTVVTGRVESGRVRPGDEIEIVGLKKTQKTTVTGVEMFHKSLESGDAGDNVGCLLRGLKRDDVSRGQVHIAHSRKTSQCGARRGQAWPPLSAKLARACNSYRFRPT